MCLCVNNNIHLLRVHYLPRIFSSLSMLTYLLHTAILPCGTPILEMRKLRCHSLCSSNWAGNWTYDSWVQTVLLTTDVHRDGWMRGWTEMARQKVIKMIHGYVCNDEKLEKIVHQIVKMRPLQSGLQWAWWAFTSQMIQCLSK